MRCSDKRGLLSQLVQHLLLLAYHMLLNIFVWYLMEAKSGAEGHYIKYPRSSGFLRIKILLMSMICSL
jgi:hypothetical protein